MKRIGIIGGGQLARMMIYESRKLGFYFAVLDPAEEPAAGPCADRHIHGGLYDEISLRDLVESSDVSTYDIEHIDTAVLKRLEGEGNVIEPSPRILEIIQDKYVQKTTFSDAGLPVGKFYAVENVQEIDTSATAFPFVQKARTGGYDGRGVAVIRRAEDLSLLLRRPSVIEEYISFEKELAVMVARSVSGEIRSYPVVEMTFDPDSNICDEVLAPADIPPSVYRNAREVAEEAVRVLGGTGVYGVELFLSEEGQIVLNEVAPRPHNSGHYTIEACVTSQFEQHIRGISGLPLGSTELLAPSVMINLLGQKGPPGPTAIRGTEAALSVSGCSLHFYGKTSCRENRKMGHATIIGAPASLAEGTPQKIRDQINTLRKSAKQVKDIIEIGGGDGR